MSQLRPSRLFLPLGVLALGLATLPPASSGAAEIGKVVQEMRAPRLFPDYSGTVIPPNIAPLNFSVLEAGQRYQVTIHAGAGKPIVLSGRSATAAIPPGPWKTLLRAQAGQTLFVEVAVQDGQGQWHQFQPLTNTIARDDLDGHLVYRLLKPLYNIYVNLGIYQRDLQTFEEKPVLQNRAFGGGCLNCHTFLHHQADTFALHIRTETNFHPMLLVRSNAVCRVDKTAGYLSWHPSGRLLAFSANKLSLFYHTIGETRDVFDAHSDLGIFRIDSNIVVSPLPLARPDRNETWPSWAPDGRHLYYCSAPKLPQDRFRQILYDLLRIRYDLEQDRWGEPETLVSAQECGLSAAQPRVSPDGRWLLFCRFKYGNFPVYRPDSDLYVMDLRTRQSRRLDINSDQAESWHCWSGNGRWVVFSSKRLDGLFARPHFSYVDEQGVFHKPFLLPQKDPAFYSTCLNTFNVPELVREAIAIKPDALARAMGQPAKVLKPKADTPQEHHEQ